MSVYFITGVAGTGKSTILNELVSRGYEAYGVDEDGYAHWHNNQTGNIHPKSSVKTHHRTSEFISNNTWKISREMVEELAKQSEGRTVFLCGVASNDDEIWDLFSKIFTLVLDEATLRHRLATRTTNDYGKTKHELEQTLKQVATIKELSAKYGYIKIDATRSVNEIVDYILAEVGA